MEGRVELIVDERYSYLVDKYKIEYVLKSNSSPYGMWKIRVNNRFRSLARFITEQHLSKELPANIFVDHVDRDTSNNVLSNLRLTTSKLNLNNKTTANPVVEAREYFRLDYGRNSEGNRIRTPLFYGKSDTEIKRISKYFHSLCQGTILAPYEYEDKEEFMKIFKSVSRYESWLATYGKAIEQNLIKIEDNYNAIKEFSGKPFGTTLDKF